MCGIAGFNFRVNDKNILNSLYHRGPDKQSKWSDDTISLFHTRLAIQDIKGGHQPFFYQNYVIIFNGEIYNHLELRKELIEFDFKTKSDTETLLYLYLKYKKNMFKNIDGMFAFAIYDTSKKELFLARDRAGKKPLYTYQKGKNFGFASEINGFKFLNPSIDEGDIQTYLSTGFCESGYKEIKEFPPGCYGKWKIENEELRIEKYFNILEFYNKPKLKNIDETLELVDDLLLQSVKNRLFSSDVEVGAFLSGGIDSSLVVAKASEFQKIKTFTVRFKGQFDESYLAKLVSQKYNTDHTVIDVKIDFDEIEKIILNYGKPFYDSSAIPSYFVSKEARKYTKVILNGDGADEIFAGYRRYVPLANGWDKVAKYFNFLLPYLSPNTRGLRMFLYRLIRASKKEGLPWYNVLLGDLWTDLIEFDIKKLDNFINNIALDNFDKMLYLDFVLNLRYDLLVKIDIATMSNSLEGRSPFLSKYFLEFAPLIDKNLKIKGTTTKYILRELAKKYLPNELISAPKRGFEVPLTKWVNSELNEMIREYLKKGFSANFIDKKVIQNVIDKKINIPEDKRAKILYQLFCLELWYENSIS